MPNIGIPDNPNPAPNYMYEEVFANPLDFNAGDSNAFYCLITGDTEINLLNTRVGAKYLIQLTIDSTGGYTITLGDLFRGAISGSGVIDNSAGAVNFISVIRGRGGYLTYYIINVTVQTTTTTTTTTT